MLFYILYSELKEYKMAVVISFANQKGGVGKTTTAINIAASLATIKKRVLLIDIDSQGNAGTGLGFVRASHKQSAYGVLLGTATITENILTTAIPNLHLLPASAKLAGAELDIIRFSRFERGEGIEKRKDDLAAEIAAMQK